MHVSEVMPVRPGLVSAVVLTAVMVVPAAAQPALDRVLGNAPSGLPFTVGGEWPQLVGSLARATGVPMGVESANLSLVPPIRDEADRADAARRARHAGPRGRLRVARDGRRHRAAAPAGVAGRVTSPRSSKSSRAAAGRGHCATGAGRGLRRAGGGREPGQMPERRRFSFTFPGGRLIDFLNGAVARARDAGLDVSRERPP